MSILTSTGTGISSKIYINNIHMAIGYIVDVIYAKLKWGVAEDKKWELRFTPIFEKKHSFLPIAPNTYAGEEFSTCITYSAETQIKDYEMSGESEEKFFSSVQPRFYNCIHEILQKKIEEIKEDNSDNLIAFKIENIKHWKTVNAYPENRSSLDYV